MQRSPGGHSCELLWNEKFCTGIGKRISGLWDKCKSSKLNWGEGNTATTCEIVSCFLRSETLWSVVWPSHCADAGFPLVEYFGFGVWERKEGWCGLECRGWEPCFRVAVFRSGRDYGFGLFLQDGPFEYFHWWAKKIDGSITIAFVLGFVQLKDGDCCGTFSDWRDAGFSDGKIDKAAQVASLTIKWYFDTTSWNT